MTTASASSAGHIAENLISFARLLRRAGLPVGSGQVLDAIRAVAVIGLDSREDLYWCLFSLFVTSHRQHELFDQAFHIYWRNPRLRERLLGAMLPQMADAEAPESAALSRRVREALAAPAEPGEDASQEVSFEVDARHTASAVERLQEKDFEAMSTEEEAEARRLLATLRLPLPEARTRRFRRSERPGRADMRATLRSALRNPGAIRLRFRQPLRRPAPIVMLCDISGSMGHYSRMLLHFMHALTNERQRVHSFVFGTRLSNISRYLRQRDVDTALAQTGAAVLDWSGGTRIGACLRRFNVDWSRRVLGGGALTLLITDGLERDDESLLDQEMARLARSSRRLVWLNPLLRYEGFEPRAAGIRAMLPHVDEFRSAHNIASLSALAAVLAGEG